MSDAAVVGRLLDEYHDRRVEPSGIRVLAGSEHQAQVAYLVTLPDGRAHVIRAFRADEPVPVDGQAVDGQRIADWLTGRARTLALLADAAYPAPRPVRTRTGELVGVAGVWLTWATTYVSGPVVSPTVDQLRQIGAALGHLHSIAALPGGDRIGDGPPGRSSQHPAVAVPASSDRLDRAARLLPGEWRHLDAQFRAVLTVAGAAVSLLPETIVHGDVWARNVVQSSLSGVTFVGWEAGGLGLAVLDLGAALLGCHLDAAPGEDQRPWRLIEPSAVRITALAEGYAAVRSLSAVELDLLPDAVKFSTAVAGSVHFDVALTGAVSGPAMDARLARLENRLAVADEIAAIATDNLSG